MATRKTGGSVKAKEGERMIEIRVRFWTDNIAGSKGYINPKHAWTSGAVRIVSNESHGIVAGKPRPFNSLLDLGVVMERVLMDHGVKLHPSRRMRRYLDNDAD